MRYRYTRKFSPILCLPSCAYTQCTIIIISIIRTNNDIYSSHIIVIFICLACARDYSLIIQLQNIRWMRAFSPSRISHFLARTHKLRENEKQ